MKWCIDKQFSFAYGHRVWSQLLNDDFCENGDTACKCRHLHGHEGLVHVFLESDELKNGMVQDFKHLGWLKNFLDDVIDHKFIIDRHDPLFDSMVLHPYFKSGFCPVAKDMQYKQISVPGTPHIAGHVLMLDDTIDFDPPIFDTPIAEYLQSFFIVDFVPTSENLSKWLFDIVDAKMSSIGVKCSRIEWFETPKSRSSYQR